MASNRGSACWATSNSASDEALLHVERSPLRSGGWGIVQHGRPYNCSVGRLGPSGVEREKGWRVEARCARGLGNRPTRTTLQFSVAVSAGVSPRHLTVGSGDCRVNGPSVLFSIARQT